MSTRPDFKLGHYLAAYIAEERRFRRHALTLPPDSAHLEPLAAVAWTSTLNGYTAKVFEVGDITEDVATGWRLVSLRERDSADFSPVVVPPVAVSTVSVVPAAQSVPGFDVSGTSVPDATGAARRPALKLIWDGEQDDATGITWEIRLTATGVTIARGSTHEVATGEIDIAEGILPSTAYEARAKLITEREMIWTAWDGATTPATPPVTRADIAAGAISDEFQSVALGPFVRAGTPDGTVLFTLTMGAIGAGQIWRRGLHFDMRSLSGFNIVECELQQRHALVGGSLTAWLTIVTYDTDTGGGFGTANTNWDQYTNSNGLAGQYDDYQYRFRVVTRPISGSGDWLKNVYLTLARVTR